MARTAEDYKGQLFALLPPGHALPRDAGSRLDELLRAVSEEPARVDVRVGELVRDANPLDTVELLPDWERVAGLPDTCSGEFESTQQGRRSALLSKLSSTGGQSLQYFIDVAAALGYAVTITEFRPFRAGFSAAGDSITNGDWVYAWRVNGPEVTVISFSAGLSAAGEPLRVWGNASLECKINQLKPAHTLVIFGYEEESVIDEFLSADALYFFANYTLPNQVT